MAQKSSSNTLSAEQRQELRSAIRVHPDVLKHVPSLSAVSALNKAELLQAASNLGIDVEAVKNGSWVAQGPTFDSPEGRALQQYGDKHPAFSGTLEDDVTVVLFGQSVTRRFRVTYDMTPEWPYFDLNQGKEMKGWWQSSMSYEILVEGEGEYSQSSNGKVRYRRGKDVWVNCTEIFGHDGLGQYFDDVIDDLIEEKCLRENEERKRAAGLV